MAFTKITTLPSVWFTNFKFVAHKNRFLTFKTVFAPHIAAPVTLPPGAAAPLPLPQLCYTPTSIKPLTSSGEAARVSYSPVASPLPSLSSEYDDLFHYFHAVDEFN
jgi:hypothetical protein